MWEKGRETVSGGYRRPNSPTLRMKIEHYYPDPEAIAANYTGRWQLKWKVTGEWQTRTSMEAISV